MGGEESHRRFFLQVEFAQALNGFGRDERSVARKNNDVVVGSEGVAGDHEGVTGAALFGLENEIYPGLSNGLADTVGFVSDDGKDVAGGDDFSGGSDHVSEQGFAADFMKNFRIFRFEACAFAGSHDGDGDAGRVGFRHLFQYSAED